MFGTIEKLYAICILFWDKAEANLLIIHWLIHKENQKPRWLGSLITETRDFINIYVKSKVISEFFLGVFWTFEQALHATSFTRVCFDFTASLRKP